MTSYAVLDCNSTRNAERLLRTLREKHNDAPWYADWGMDYSALLHAWAVMSARLDTRRREVAEQCAPWFEVQQ